MNRSTLSTAMLAAAIFTPGIASADWTGDVELGYVKTGGNTTTSSLNAKAKAEQELEKWRNTLNFEAVNNSTDNKATAERYLATGQTSYKFTERSYFFGFLSHEDDRFSGYDYRTSANIGYGNRVVKNDKVTLDLEIAPGARKSKLLDTGRTEDEATLRGTLKLLWNISKTSKLTEDLYSEVGDKDKGGTVTRSVTALTSQVNGSLSTRITYTAKHSTVVPVDKKHVDDEVAITLVYAFGKK